MHSCLQVRVCVLQTSVHLVVRRTSVKGPSCTTVLALNLEELRLLKKHLDTQQIHLQHPTIMSSFFNIQRQYSSRIDPASQ